MNNPYETLGIKEGASKEEIKAAYKAQVKKYHPDRHQDNPLYELAEEKLQEINEAYEYLMKNGGGASRGGGGSGFGSRAGSAGSGAASTPEFQDVRGAIDRGDLARAQEILSGSAVRNGEWYFLTAMLNLRRGWYDEAVANLRTAISMEPSNFEYRSAMNNLMSRTGGYRNAAYGRGYQDGNSQLCQFLQCWCCADMLCDCI
ncbi:MAG: DnaJ domain-containing protein [Clostridiales Family XIII bacterium]|jgi:molecular chaperone DnaJ|nr:DnaJ domain-containing protein [Clostridiales Family XIII bacterium]